MFLPMISFSHTSGCLVNINFSLKLIKINQFIISNPIKIFHNIILLQYNWTIKHTWLSGAYNLFSTKCIDKFWVLPIKRIYWSLTNIILQLCQIYIEQTVFPLKERGISGSQHASQENTTYNLENSDVTMLPNNL